MNNFVVLPDEKAVTRFCPEIRLDIRWEVGQDSRPITSSTFQRTFGRAELAHELDRRWDNAKRTHL